MSDSIVGAVVPTAAARVALRPIDARDVQLEGGLLGERQRTNREVTILRGAEELERAGTLDNLRIAAGRTTGERRGMVFSDSDVYKWLEALGWELGREPSDELARLNADAIELVAAAQEPDGYLNWWCQVVEPAWRWTDLQQGHELYCAGHLMQAAVAQHARPAPPPPHRCDAVRRLIDETSAAGRRPGRTGIPRSRSRSSSSTLHGRGAVPGVADTLVGRRGFGLFGHDRFGPRYYQDVEPVRGSRSIAGMPSARCTSPPASPTSTPNPPTSSCSKRCSASGTTSPPRSLPHGRRRLAACDEAFGDPYELPPDRAYCETCAAIASIMWNWRLLSSPARAGFADLLERTLYNGFLSGVSLDGARSSTPTRCIPAAADERQRGTLSRAARRTSCACSPPSSTTSRPERGRRAAPPVRTRRLSAGRGPVAADRDGVSVAR